MRCLFSVVLATTLLVPCSVSCATQATVPAVTASSAASSGTSIATAIVLSEDNDAGAVGAEDVWIAQHYPGSQKTGQSLLQDHGRSYDAIDIVNASGASKKVYFDITKAYDALDNLFKKAG